MLVARTVATISGWITLFAVFNNFGENFRTAFDELNLSIYNIPWNVCTVRVQKMTALMLTVSREPIQLLGFGGIACSLDTFGRVS